MRFRFRLSTLAALCFLLVSGCGAHRAVSGGEVKRDFAREAAVRTRGLELEAKAAQVLLIGIQGSGTPARSTIELLERLPVGGVVLFSFNLPESPVDLGRYTGALQDAVGHSTSPLPLIIAIDHEGGSVFRFKGGGITRIPAPSHVGMRGETYALALGRAAGSELRSLGVNMALAPVVELLTEQNKRFLGSRSYGRSPAVVDACAGAYIEGLQDRGVAAVAKHFPGNAAEDPHRGLPVLDIDRSVYERDYAPRFVSASRHGVAGLMLSHVLVESLDEANPVTLSRTIITGELKGKLGFRGLVITDDLYMKALSEKTGPEKTAVSALAAGADLLMLTAMEGAEKVQAAIVQAVKEGVLPAQRLDDAVTRVIELKLRFNLDSDLDPEVRKARLEGFEALVKANALRIEQSSSKLVETNPKSSVDRK
jgi:beta-N-acetylhexosaminidase